MIGYSIDDPAATLQAFHHHYRGHSATTLDAKDLRILSALTKGAKTSSPRPALEPIEGDNR